MKILFLARSLERGGAERQLVAVANGLAAKGHEVAVALFYCGGSLEQDLANIQIIPLEKTGRWDVFSFCMRLVGKVRAFEPDVIYSFLGTPNLLAATLKPFWKGARVVWSVRASDMDYSHYDKAAMAANWFEARCARFADLIIANSGAGAEHAISKGMPRETMRVILNGIDTKRFYPNRAAGISLRQQWKVPHRSILVGLVARIDPMKDHETFLRAARIVADEDDDIRFICIGGGEREYVNAMKKFAEGFTLGCILTWAGELDCMEAVYNALDVCCLSSMTEGFPNVIGEAMSCNVPCVVSDVGDAAFIVGEVGVVVPKRDAEALAAGMLEVISRVRSGYANTSRQRIVATFSLEQMIVKTEQALRV